MTNISFSTHILTIDPYFSNMVHSQVQLCTFWSYSFIFIILFCCAYKAMIPIRGGPFQGQLVFAQQSKDTSWCLVSRCAMLPGVEPYICRTLAKGRELSEVSQHGVQSAYLPTISVSVSACSQINVKAVRGEILIPALFITF